MRKTFTQLTTCPEHVEGQYFSVNTAGHTSCPSVVSAQAFALSLSKGHAEPVTLSQSKGCNAEQVYPELSRRKESTTANHTNTCPELVEGNYKDDLANAGSFSFPGSCHSEQSEESNNPQHLKLTTYHPTPLL